MRYGCCAPLDQYELVKAAGFDSMVLAATEVIEMEEDELRRVREMMAQDHISCTALNGFCEADLILCGEGFEEEAVAVYAKRLMPRAAALGITMIGIGAPKSRVVANMKELPQDMKQFETSIRILCEEAAKWNMEILMESVCTLQCNFITTNQESCEFVRRLNLDNLFMVYDTYHAYMMRENPAYIHECADKIHIVHVCENKDNQRYYLTEENEEQLRPYLAEIQAVGYDGEVAVESFVTYESAAADMIRSRKILGRLV